MGEQFIDLFSAGAYALVGRLYGAFSAPGFAWIFYLLASASIVFAIIQGAMEQRQEFWVRHMAAVCLAAVLTLAPRSVDITQLTYAAPGEIEKIFGTREGAAPHLTYWIERLGASVALALKSLTHQRPFLAVPGVAGQVSELVGDPATINDRQLKANLDIWRRRIVPQLLAENPDLSQAIADKGLGATLLNPTPSAAQFVGAAPAAQARTLRDVLAAGHYALPRMVVTEGPLVEQISRDAGATTWSTLSDPADVVLIAFSEPVAASSARRMASASPAFDDALQRGDSLLQDLRAQLPAGGSPIEVKSVDQLYDLLGRSVLFSAGKRLAGDPAARATLGSLCQRAGDAACRSAMAPLIDTATRLRVPDADRFNRSGWTTWLQQPIATALLTVTSLMLSTLSSLVVSVLPFALGVAKSMAILISVIGTWMLLWPGRARIALSWMVGPISFVSLWGVLFNIWSDIEPWLSQIALVVGDSDEGSFSARRLMTIAIALGYMGLPSLALGLVYGESGRALYHASARLETALLMAWHTRGSIAAFGRRWIVNSPMVRRWNQRAYRAIGMGPLRSSPARSGSSGRSRPAKSTPRAATSGRRPAATSPPAGTPDLFGEDPSISPKPHRKPRN